MKKMLLSCVSWPAAYAANTKDQIDGERAAKILGPLARYFRMLPS